MPRKHTHKSVDDYLPYGTNGDQVPEMAHAGEGYNFHVTGLTHDERGYPNMTPPVQDKLVRRLQSKVRDAADRIALFEEEHLEGADVVVVSYGITSRVAQRAIGVAREQRSACRQIAADHGMAVSREEDSELAATVKAFVVPELNLGQMVREVERAAAGRPKLLPCRTQAAEFTNPKRFSK